MMILIFIFAVKFFLGILFIFVFVVGRDYE